MSQPSSNRHRSAIAAVILLVLASLVLAACGSSSSTSSTSTSTNASASTSTSNGTPGARGNHFVALRECLQKAGITLPKRTPGQRPGGGFLGGAGGASVKLPSGVTRAQYEAAIKKCGGFAGGGRFGGAGGAGGARFKSAAFKQALVKFADCLRENGVKVPAPNTSGKGPIFDTKGIDTSSAQFRAAETKCSAILRSTLKPQPGAAAPGAAAPGANAPQPAG